MTRTRSFPIYVVRFPPVSDGCGHQHDSHERARNCALNIMKKHRGLSRANIIRIRRHAVSRHTIETPVEVIDREAFNKVMEN